MTYTFTVAPPKLTTSIALATVSTTDVVETDAPSTAYHSTAQRAYHVVFLHIILFSQLSWM